MFFQLGLGAGTFFAAPRLSYDSLVNQKLPLFSIALGKQLGTHLTVNSIFGFQPFSTKEFILGKTGIEKLESVFRGYCYAWELTPMVSVLPTFHHISRPTFDFNLGLGLGYLLTYRTEKFTFNEKAYKFNLIEQSAYIPIRTNFTIRVGVLTNLILEGAFFHTFLNEGRSPFIFKKNSDHFGQLMISYKKRF